MHAAAACGLYPGRGQLALQSDPLSATGDVITIVKSLDCATKLQHAVQPVVASTLATSVVPNAAWILHEADKHVALRMRCVVFIAVWLPFTCVHCESTCRTS